jgi:hypothetical protein
MPVNNAMASRAIVYQLTPLMPKDNVQAAGQPKQLYALLEAAPMTNLALVEEVGR